MTLPASFPLTMTQIATELGTTLPLNLLHADVRALAEQPSGDVAYSDLLGKSAGGGGGGVPTVTYHGTETSGIGRDIGTAAADRYVIAIIHWRATATNRTLSSITIDGGAATIHAQSSHTGGSTSLGVAIVSRLVTSGTTADIVPSYSGAVSTQGIAVWDMVGATNASPTDTDTNTDAGIATRTDLSLNVPAGGCVISGVTMSSGAVNKCVTWLGIETPEDYDHCSTTPLGMSGGHANNLTGDTTHSVSADINETADAGMEMVGLSWR